jgi:hypothetical protein
MEMAHQSTPTNPDGVTMNEISQRVTRAFFGMSLVAPLAAIAAQQPKPVVIPRLTDAQQIASAVLALPVQFRADARVLGYKSGSKELVPLRDSKGAFTCLATQPDEPLHLACYHNSLEPFMLRGRELRAKGVKDAQVDTVRFAEVMTGKLAMPKQPAALYQLFGGTYDAAANTVASARPLFVIYISGATSATTGLPDKPAAPGEPWIMFPGTPKAHIMLNAKM